MKKNRIDMKSVISCSFQLMNQTCDSICVDWWWRQCCWWERVRQQLQQAHLPCWASKSHKESLRIGWSRSWTHKPLEFGRPGSRSPCPAPTGCRRCCTLLLSRWGTREAPPRTAASAWPWNSETSRWWRCPSPSRWSTHAHKVLDHMPR